MSGCCFQVNPSRAIRSASIPSSCDKIAEWAARRRVAGIFSAAVTATDRSLSRSVMADTNCLVSVSLGFLSCTIRSDFSYPSRQLGALPGELADLRQRNPELVGATLVDERAGGDGCPVNQRRQDRG